MAKKTRNQPTEFMVMEKAGRLGLTLVKAKGVSFSGRNFLLRKMTPARSVKVDGIWRMLPAESEDVLKRDSRGRKWFTLDVLYEYLSDMEYQAGLAKATCVVEDSSWTATSI